MIRYLGVDPGLSGALAIIETINSVPVLIDAIDMPVTGTGAKARVDVIAVAKWVAGTHHRSFTSNARRHFRGKALPPGLLTVAASVRSKRWSRLPNLPFMLIEPSVWKRKLQSPRQRQRSRPTARLATIPATTRSARTAEGSRPR